MVMPWMRVKDATEKCLSMRKCFLDPKSYTVKLLPFSSMFRIHYEKTDEVNAEDDVEDEEEGSE